MIAQSENNDSVAIESYSKAISMLSHQYDAYNDHAFHFFTIAMTHYKMKNWQQAQQQFEKIIDLNAGRLQWGDIYARSYYWLGRIHQIKNQKHEAIRNYQKFLELWKDADPGIPELKQAKNELEFLF